jgi:hypothetical protein
MSDSMRLYHAWPPTLRERTLAPDSPRRLNMADYVATLWQIQLLRETEQDPGRIERCMPG